MTFSPRSDGRGARADRLVRTLPGVGSVGVVRLRSEELPRFPEAFVSPPTRTMRGEVDGFAAAQGGDGNDVPGVVRDDPSSQEIYVARSQAIFARASGGGHLEDVAVAASDGADLDARQPIA